MMRKRAEKLCLRTMSYESFKHSLHEELSSSSQCREKAVTEVARLSRLLRHVDSVDGRLFDIRDGSIVADERAEKKMREFKSAARVLIGSRPVLTPSPCFTRAGEREPATLGSLTQVANFMGITAQQRKLIRTAACREVTQHCVWVDTLEAILNALRPELDFLDSRAPSKGTQMGRQILDNCLALLRDEKADPATSWMKLKPTRWPSLSDPPKDPPRRSWEDVRLMFKDLIVCLRGEGLLLSHVVKLEAMKEGLSHIKDVSMDRTVVGYREAKQHEYEVKKILTTFLGYPSRCLFTLLLNYLFGQVRDIEIDLSGGFYDKGSQGFRVFAGRVLSSGQEEMVMSGMRQLDRAFRLFGFVFETAGVNGVLNFEGHIWCVGAEARVIEYNGKRFFLHGITI